MDERKIWSDYRIRGVFELETGSAAEDDSDVMLLDVRRNSNQQIRTYYAMLSIAQGHRVQFAADQF